MRGLYRYSNSRKRGVTSQLTWSAGDARRPVKLVALLQQVPVQVRAVDAAGVGRANLQLGPGHVVDRWHVGISFQGEQHGSRPLATGGAAGAATEESPGSARRTGIPLEGRARGVTEYCAKRQAGRTESGHPEAGAGSDKRAREGSLAPADGIDLLAAEVPCRQRSAFWTVADFPSCKRPVCPLYPPTGGLPAFRMENRGKPGRRDPLRLSPAISGTGPGGRRTAGPGANRRSPAPRRRDPGPRGLAGGTRGGARPTTIPPGSLVPRRLGGQARSGSQPIGVQRVRESGRCETGVSVRTAARIPPGGRRGGQKRSQCRTSARGRFCLNGFSAG